MLPDWLWPAIKTGIAHGLGLSGMLLALGLSLEGLMFLAAVQGCAFLIAHQVLIWLGRVPARRYRLTTPLKASTTLGWVSGAATSAKRIS